MGILFLDRNGFLLFSDTLNQVIQCNFPTTIVRDLEIINQEQFGQLLGTFFKSAGISPSQIVILLSDNLLFEKLFQSPQSEKDKKDLEQFMENLPFEHVGSIIYTSNNESKFIATNKDLYQGIEKELEKLSWTVTAIIPAFIAGMDINQIASLTPSLASDLFRRAVSLRQYSFLTDTTKQQTFPKDKSFPEKENKPQNSDEYVSVSDEKKGEASSHTRLFILLGVFGLLIAVLIVTAIVFL